MMNFFKRIFGERGIKPQTTSAVKTVIPENEDPWDQVVVTQDKEGLAKMTKGAAIIAKEERLGKQVEPVEPTEGKPPVA